MVFMTFSRVGTHTGSRSKDLGRRSGCSTCWPSKVTATPMLDMAVQLTLRISAPAHEKEKEWNPCTQKGAKRVCSPSSSSHYSEPFTSGPPRLRIRARTGLAPRSPSQLLSQESRTLRMRIVRLTPRLRGAPLRPLRLPCFLEPSRPRIPWRAPLRQQSIAGSGDGLSRLIKTTGILRPEEAKRRNIAATRRRRAIRLIRSRYGRSAVLCGSDTTTPLPIR